MKVCKTTCDICEKEFGHEPEKFGMGRVKGDGKFSNGWAEASCSSW